MNKVQHVKWCMKLTSEISFPTDSLLAQLAERGTDDLDVAGNFELCKNSIEILTSDVCTVEQKLDQTFPNQFCYGTQSDMI